MSDTIRPERVVTFATFIGAYLDPGSQMCVWFVPDHGFVWDANGSARIDRVIR